MWWGVPMAGLPVLGGGRYSANPGPKAAVGLLKPSREASANTPAPEWDHMRSFRLTSLVAGAAFSVSVASFAEHVVLAD